MAAGFVRSQLHLQAWAPGDPRSVIAALSADILRYEAEMTRLKNVLCELENDWMQLTQRHNEYLSSIQPIQRVPAEVLAEIFSFSDSACRNEYDLSMDSILAGEALKHLAHSPLYTVSQVSGAWHAVAMGTPTLWREITLDAVLWESSEALDRLMLVLPQILDRGGSSSLSISVRCRNTSSDPRAPVLELLAQNSERWQSAEFSQTVLDLSALSAANGRFPRLMSLSLIGGCTPGSLDIFQEAPHLQVLSVVCTPTIGTAITRLPLHQLSILRCFEPLFESNTTMVSLLALLYLSPSAEFQLRFAAGAGALTWTQTLRHITSPLSNFMLHLIPEFSPSDSETAVGKVFDTLTLPSLSQLDMNAYTAKSAFIYWPQTQFIHLALRSEFTTHLQMLHLCNVVIEQHQLLECLDHLSSLEHLAISDIPTLHNGASQVLLSDSLLVALTRRPDTSSLLPRLSGLMAHSMLKFDDKVLLQFARSRVDNVELFELDVFGIEGFVRELDSEVEEQLDELENLAYMWEPVDDE